MKRLLALCLLGCSTLAAQQAPAATELPGSPIAIKKTWFVGGVGNWDYLTMDPAAGRLFIAHSAQVQVVDVESGQVAGTISGLREAHAVVLDPNGELGYISDGQANQVKVFDRRTLQVVASIPTGPAPHALVFEPENQLLFAVCTPLTTGNPPPGAGPARTPADLEIKSSITVIDAVTRQRLGEILMPGRMGFAAADAHGQVFINVVNRNQIVRLDAGSIAALFGRRADRAAAARQADTQPPAVSSAPGPARSAPSSATPPASAQGNDTPSVLDWSHENRLPNSAANRMMLFSLGPDCREPSALAVDGSHERLFAACTNMKLVVLNAGTGELVASLPIGPGTEAIGYDSAHGLIYAANGGAQGTLTVIRQDVTDTYAEIQNLATRQRARTLAINPATGLVYLVTDLLGVKLDRPGGIGTLKTVPIEGSFQVLVIGK
jgi:DNA-binding beta-propeller fold protein YncE